MVVGQDRPASCLKTQFSVPFMQGDERRVVSCFVFGLGEFECPGFSFGQGFSEEEGDLGGGCRNALHGEDLAVFQSLQGEPAHPGQGVRNFRGDAGLDSVVFPGVYEEEEREKFHFQGVDGVDSFPF